MRSRPTLRSLAILMLVGLLLQVPSMAEAQQNAPCPSGVRLAASAPSSSAPTTVNVSLSPAVNLKAVGGNDPTSFHLHYFVDTPATGAGRVIPGGDAKVIHSGSTTEDVGPLSPGMHTVTVVLGRFNHMACEPRDSVTFIVGQAQGVLIAPKSGGAGLADEGTAALLVVVLIGLAIAVVVGARMWTTRGGPR